VDELSFELLGPLRVYRRGRPVPLRAAKQRRLLATLLLHPNRFVSTDLIVDVLWDADPPRSAIANVRTYVRAVREALGTSALLTHQSGYSIMVGADAIDATRFTTLVGQAGRSRQAGRDVAAIESFERGLKLWQGRPLEDLELAPAWEGAVVALQRAHHAAVDELIELRLATGEHAEAQELLRARLAEDPYDEDLWCALVECLLATGRRHEARRAYTDAVRILDEELDVEPGPALLAMGAAIDRPAAARPMRSRAAVARRQVPSQLPLDVATFAGRTAELRRLRDVVCGSGNRPPVAVVSGAPGTGKTALAVHLGHLAKDVFTDGQVYLDMRGAARPRDPAGALFEILRALGVPEVAIPAEVDRRSAVLRSELASRRVLVIIDDAGSAGQVAPLLPGTGDSALIITSQRRLSDLTAAAHIHLDVLAPDSASALLRGLAGADRVSRDDPAVAEIVGACGNLPLAIRIAAGRLVQRPDLTPAALAGRLRDERGRLDELSLGELAVRSSAEESYRALGAAESRLYRLLGLLGAVEFPAWALSVVPTGTPVERCLDSLIEANLLQVVGADRAGVTRYRVHDLLRLHGAELAGPQARDDLGRVLDVALTRSRMAARRLPTRFFGLWESSALVGEVPGGGLAGPEDAIDWFDDAQGNVISLIHAASAQGLHEQAWRLAAAWTPYFDLRGHFDHWGESHELALTSARASGSARGEAIILCGVAQLGLYRDDWDSAYAGFTSAREIFTGLGDLSGRGVAAAGLGTWHRERGLWDRAMPFYEEALEAFVGAGDPHGEAVARTAIATVWLLRKDTTAAETWLKQAFDLAVEIGDAHREAQIRRRFAIMHELSGSLDKTVHELRTALTIFERLSDDNCASHTRASLGEALLRRGDHAAARRMFLAALTVVHRRGDRNIEARAAAHLGHLHQAAGRTNSARAYLLRAMSAWQLAANPQRSEEIREHLRSLAG
jgi:DNA-binding SARP family transcriptional activator